MDQRADQLRDWIHAIDQHVGVARELVAHAAAPTEARLLAAGALNYVVTKLDLIPDWEPVIGVLDDAIVLRVALAMCAEKDLGPIGAELLAGIGRLANEVDAVRDLVGPELYPKLSRYVRDLTKKDVRGRLPQTIVDDEKVRGTLFREVDLELRDVPGDTLTDADQTVRALRNYLTLKLRAY